MSCAGRPKIDGRDVIVVAEDFTVRGGSSEATNPEKWQYVERLALTYRWPVIRLVETAGGSVNLLEQMSATKIPGYPHWPMVELLATVPVVGVALGAAAGLGAVRVCASHLSIMTAEGSYLFAGGPAVVKKAVGEDVTNASSAARVCMRVHRASSTTRRPTSSRHSTTSSDSCRTFRRAFTSSLR